MNTLLTTLEDNKWLSISQQERRDYIDALEVSCKTLPDGKDDILIRDHFSVGVYLREGLIPKGFLIIGEIHKYDHLNILVSGTIRIATETGVKTYIGPTVFESSAGTKKAGICLEEAIFMTVHKTDLKDADKVREEHTLKEHIPLIEG